MKPKTAIERNGNDAKRAAGLPDWPSSAEIESAVSAGAGAAQHILGWMERDRESQAAALNGCSKALRAALDAAANAKQPVELMEAQSGLFNAVSAQLLRSQADAMAAWAALLAELMPRPPSGRKGVGQQAAAAGKPDGALAQLDWNSAIEQAKNSIDEAARQWQSFWLPATAQA